MIKKDFYNDKKKVYQDVTKSTKVNTCLFYFLKNLLLFIWESSAFVDQNTHMKTFIAILFLKQKMGQHSNWNIFI